MTTNASIFPLIPQSQSASYSTLSKSMADGIVSQELEQYIRRLSTPHSSILDMVEQETRTIFPQVAHQSIGPVQGKVGR